MWLYLSEYIITYCIDKTLTNNASFTYFKCLFLSLRFVEASFVKKMNEDNKENKFQINKCIRFVKLVRFNVTFVT